jgi:hypothetical protein
MMQRSYDDDRYYRSEKSEAHIRWEGEMQAQHARDKEAYEQWFGDKPVGDFLAYWNPTAQHLGDYCEDQLRNAYDRISGELEAPIPDDDLWEMIEGITAYVKQDLEG